MNKNEPSEQSFIPFIPHLPCLDGDVFKVAVVDVVPGERPLVADAASDKALEDEHVALHLVFLLELTIREIKIKKVVTLLNGEVVRCPILRYLDVEQHERMVLGELVGISPFKEYAQVDLQVGQRVGTHGAWLVVFRVGHGLEDNRVNIYHGILISEVVTELDEEVVGEGVDVELEQTVLLHHHLVALESQQSFT